MKGEKVWKLVRMVLFCTLFYGITISTAAVNAQEVQSVETESSVLFTGVYEPIGQPDPAPPAGPTENISPPNEVAKPGGILPKTNETRTYGVILLGLLLVLVVLYVQYTKHRSRFMMVKKKRQII